MQALRSNRESPWIVSNNPTNPPRLKLFCFPFAGGGTSVLRDWAKLFPADVEVCLVQYPGKEGRMREAPFRRLLPLAKAAAQALIPYLQSPFAFFGYSMGAIVAFEIARHLRRCGYAGPDLLVAAASSSPHGRRSMKTRFDLPERELINELRRLAGAPPEVLDNEDLIQLFLPAIRADFEAIETYRFDGNYEPLTCPVVAIGGSRDPDIGAAELDEWSVQTTSRFNRHLLPGNHFFLLNDSQAVADLVVSHLGQFTRTSPGSM